MKLSNDLIRKLRRNAILELTESDLLELRSYYRSNSKRFVNLIKRCLAKVKRKEDLDLFFFLEEKLGGIFYDISLFLSYELNNIFVIMVDNHFYKKFVEYEKYINACGNGKILNLIKKILARRDILKILERVDLYRLKKTALYLKEKIGVRNRKAEEIDMNIAPLELNWAEGI